MNEVGRDAGFTASALLAVVGSASLTESLLVFRGDRFGDTSCSGCEVAGSVAVPSRMYAAFLQLGGTGSSSASSCTIGFNREDSAPVFVPCSDSDGVLCRLRQFDRRFGGESAFL